MLSWSRKLYGADSLTKWLGQYICFPSWLWVTCKFKDISNLLNEYSLEFILNLHVFSACFEEDVAHPGNDIHFEYGVLSAFECQQTVCYPDPNCVIFTYYPSIEECHIKSATFRVPGVRPLGISGPRECFGGDWNCIIMEGQVADGRSCFFA